MIEDLFLFLFDDSVLEGKLLLVPFHHHGFFFVITHRVSGLLISAHRVVATQGLVSGSFTMPVLGLFSVVGEELDPAAVVRLRDKLLELAVNVQSDRAWVLQPRVVSVR